jgi:Zn-dependent peptidase ImmA (M78 family)/transcriptional regulator with XRE-family HTH domain
MTMGRSTPNFVPQRWIEAREVRLLTQTALAELLGISRQSVSQYEKGTHTPPPALLERAANILRVPSERFVRPLTPNKPGTAFFRSLSDATKAARKRATRRQAWLRDDIVGALSEFVELPRVNLPSLPQRQVHEIDHDFIERAATTVRRHWGLADGPISDVTLLLENHGVIVVRQELGPLELDAFSEWSEGGRPYIILNTAKGSAVRSRFDAFHELGHLLLHRHLDPSLLLSTSSHKLVERQADRFASALLMPAATFGREVHSPSVPAFLAIKPRWRVSIAAMIQRTRALGLVTDDKAKLLCMYRNQRGWTKSEPYDADWQCEQPRLIRRAIDLPLSTNSMTAEALERAASLHREDIEDIAGLERGFLGDSVRHYNFAAEAARRPAEFARPDSHTMFLPYGDKEDTASLPFGHESKLA